MPAQMLDTGRLQQLFDQAPGFMALSSGPEHVFEMVNPSYLRLVGPRDLIGRTVREAFPDLQGQQFFSLLDHVYQTGKAVTGRARPLRIQRDPEGEPEERLLDFVFQPITDANGNVTGIFAQGNDVTDLHQAELALRESEERFRLIADSAPVPMWVTKLDRKRGFVNIAYAEFVGVPYDEALDFDWRSRVHPDDAERLVQEALAGEATLKPFVLEARYLRHDGQWRWLRSESQPRWGPSGEHIGFIGVAHDITEAKEAEHKLREINETLERRVAERTADLTAALNRLQAEVNERLRAEEALRQAQKMEAVGQLTGGIAHDFNNLLTPIMGGLEIIASRATDERMKRIADTALESARRGAKLTSQLLAFSRIQRISMAPVAVNDVIANMMDLLRHTIGQKVRIETRLDPEVTHGICDPNQLENALLNLAINARDAMPEGGTLTISTGKTTLAGDAELEPGDYVCVSVADTGQGMAPEVIARATEPFFSTKPLGKGTGLGLAQVYGIARQSGGTIRIESEVAKGTTVHLFLAAASAEEAGDCREALQAAPAAIVARPTEATVLVIDDDSDVRAFLADSLEGLGYSVVEAEDGEAGLKQLADSPPDLILLDYAMPRMNGAEVARAARKRIEDVPIIFVTGYAETEQLEAALGPDVPVLRKPFSVAQLAAAVEEQIAAGTGAESAS
jgi:PAS domain S-box-containing protein